MSKGSKGSQTSTVSTQPAAFVAPYLSEAARESGRLYNEYRPEFFTGSTFVPFSPETETAFQAGTARALSGSPVQAAAQEEALRTVRGDYMGGNPFLQDMLSNEYSRISGNINSQFSKGGGYGGSANQEVLAREMTRAATNALYDNYNTERGRQQSIVAQSPQLAASDYDDINRLRAIGAEREDLFGRQLQDQMARFQFEMEQDPAALDDYIRRVTALGQGYNTRTETTPYARTSGLQTLGGIASGIGNLGQSLKIFGIL